ncbi:MULTISPECIES: hypothetical protein [unclassified Sphingomonas]|uniref:hypothetical protein n=1 Tax=unclassified Sphingomonas TaxID=196159 RepID=UPI0007018C79|nr:MULTISPECIES: hypothetical protein [unclassified Sphingomonas]KQX18368.1 hypothetical protein ASD17_14500 [Sphingomonas sp. Root1294]KQY72307.1 hypothetical protein ASD39_20475 [Sphingomonas sp. Root50]KRB94422.1 hypothetical protein ASE22_00275 [Sphingomonas sp. Root720]
MSNPLLTIPHADARRRIHIRSVGDRASYSLGVTARPIMADSVAEAVDQALAGIGYEEAVIIYEGRAS